MGRKKIRCHGDDRRFEEVARLVGSNFAGRVRYVADVAGGQGMLSRLLRKRYNLECDVIDPRGWTLRGVTNRQDLFECIDLTYYDLIVGLHPDEALKSVVHASVVRPTVVVPCCNFWSEERLGLKELLKAIERWYSAHNVPFQRHELALKTPYRFGYVTRPPGISRADRP